jgi:effector-binding domain-containing protein
MKKVLYVIIGIAVLYLILALFGPKQVKVERQVTINKPQGTVMAKMSDFKFFHDKWSPWTELDPEMKTTYEGTPGEVGHHYTWSGNKDVGSGEMRIESIQGDSIVQKLTFEGEGDAKAYHIIKDSSGVSKITWGMVFDVGFFFRPVMLFMNMDKMMGDMYDKGLAKLKTEMESMPEEVKYTITEQDWPASEYVGKKETVTFDKIAEFFGKNYGALFADLGKHKIEPQSAPSGIYTNYSEKEQKADVAAVIKVPAGTKLKGWENFSYPAGKVLYIAYYGPYEKTMGAHMAMGNYMKEKGLTESAVIEEYITDPGKEKDTTKWQTNIYYVLK